MQLYERIPIDTWKKIADRIQKLEICDFSDREFEINLILLREMLCDLDISLDFCKRYPATIGEVGLTSLLQGIYSGNVENDYKKANVYEKIYQLDELGIPSILFRPVEFPCKVEWISLSTEENSEEVIAVSKCFTDGNFDIGYPDEPLNRWFDLINLVDANYLISVLATLDTELGAPVINPLETYAILKNFNEEYPNKESIPELRYPGLCMYSKPIENDRRHFILKQFFYKFDTRNTGYSKRLVREPFNFHYE